MNEIIKCTIFLSDMNLFEKVNKVYENILTDHILQEKLYK